MTVDAPAPSLPKLGDAAPDFTANSTVGPLTFSEWQAGSWVVLFSHPADFTPVCSTELVAFAERQAEFDQRNVKLIGVSVDSVHSHLAWIENLKANLGTRVTYPLVADSDRRVAQAYGMIHPGASETVTVRALFVIDPKRVVRAVIYYPLNIGRNVDEVVRILDAFQTAEANGVACPVNWKPGDKVIVPPPKTLAEVDDRLASADEKVDFYLTRRQL